MDRLKEGIGTGMIKIAICDDKRIFAEKMQRLIDSYCTKKQILYEADLYQSGSAFLRQCDLLQVNADPDR